MSDHAFAVGQTVELWTRSRRNNAARGQYLVTRQMPYEGGEHQYRIKSTLEDHERVAKQSELRAISGHQTPEPLQHSPAAH
jgi:hypothetical protein